MFSKRRPILIAVLGASAAAGIGGGIAVAATDENSSKITALSSPEPAAISALGVGPEIPSAKALRTSPATAKDPVARAMANATVIRSDERIRVALGRESHGPLVCMSIGAPGVDAGGSTCQTLETISQGHLWIEASGLPTVGVAPDGVKTVTLSSDDGRSTSVPVTSNTYVAPRDFGPLTRLRWATGDGQHTDLRIPSPPTGR